MRVLTVCTGNVARSPALALLLADARPDWEVRSAAAGAKARPGRRMARPMRALLAQAGLGDAADAHRSQLVAEALEGWTPDVVVTAAAVHTRRMAALAPHLPVHACSPPLKDPAFGGEPAYAELWPKLLLTVDALARDLDKVPG